MALTFIGTNQECFLQCKKKTTSKWRDIVDYEQDMHFQLPKDEHLNNNYALGKEKIETNLETCLLTSKT